MARPPFQNEHSYAVDQEVMRHDDAVHWYGEMACCILLWSIDDFKANLVDRCPTCYLNDEIAQLYGQTGDTKCPDCYGTTFEGGYRALIYRPAIFKIDNVMEEQKARGVTVVKSARVQTTSDFMMRDGDYVVLADGSRWRITQPMETQISTGFGMHAGTDKVRSRFQANLEDQSSVAYLIPVNPDPMIIEGWRPYMIYPHADDIVRGPLLYPDFVAGLGVWNESYWNEFFWSTP